MDNLYHIRLVLLDDFNLFIKVFILLCFAYHVSFGQKRTALFMDSLYHLRIVDFNFFIKSVYVAGFAYHISFWQKWTT